MCMQTNDKCPYCNALTVGLFDAKTDKCFTCGCLWNIEGEQRTPSIAARHVLKAAADAPLLHPEMQIKDDEGKKIAYVIGPYRDQRGMCFVDRNIQRARALARLLWQKGYTVICPHSNSSFFDDCTDDQAFLDGYLQLLALADVAFVVPSVEGLLSYRESYGSMREIELCQIQNISVVYSYISNDGAITLQREPEQAEFGSLDQGD